MLENKGTILQYRGAKDAPLAYRFFGDGGAENALVYLHGIESHGEWFCDVAAELAARGTAVYLLDRRGAGLNTENRGDCRHYQILVDDMVKFIDLIQPRHKFIHLAGHSWGGKFALYFAVRRQFLIDSLILIAPGIATKVDLGAPTKFRLALALMLKRNPRYATPIKTEMFTRDAAALEYIARDPMRLTSATARFYFNSFLMDRYLAQNSDGLRLPVKLFLAGRDEVIDNDGVREAAARFHSRKCEITEYEDAAHCLLFEKPKQLTADLAAWLDGGWRAPVSARKILIAGAGGVGSVVGGLLAKAGHDVTLLAREAHAEAIKRRGLVMGLCTTKRVVTNIKAVTSLNDTPPQDIIIVCVKSQDTAPIAAQIARVCGANTAVLSLQNGVDNEQILADALPQAKIAGGVILGYFSVPEPGACFHKHDRGGILIAPRARIGTEEIAALRDTLSDSGMIVRTHNNCDAVKWSKLLLNVSFNALSALTSMPVEALLAHRKLFALNRRLFKECVAVMEKLGIPILDLPGYPLQRLVRASRLPAFLVRPFRKIGTSETGGMSSMWQDIRKGKGKTEIDSLNGAIVRRGKECGVPTPANAHVTRLVKELSSGDKPWDTYARNLPLVYRIPKERQ